MKELIKSVLKSNVIGRVIYEPAHALYRLYSVPHRRHLLKKYGASTLQELSRVFEKYNIPGYAAYGTLLGLVRDGGFIPHDDDVDVAIMPSERWNSRNVLRTFLKEPGFSYVFGFVYDGELVEYKLMYKKIPIDFFFPMSLNGRFATHGFYYEPNVLYPSCKHNSAKLFKEPAVCGLKNITVYGVAFPIPENVDEVLEGMYGKNWRIPDAGWADSSCPGIADLPGFGLSITETEALAL